MTEFLIRRFVKNPQELNNPAVHASYGRLAGLVGIVCNLLLFGGKLAAGLLAGSIAVAGDAVNNLSDASSSIITLVGFKLASKPADKEHPFGHAHFEYIAGLAVAVMVMVIGVELGRNSIEKIMNPTEVEFGLLTFGVLSVSIAVKVWMALFNRSVGRRIGSLALEATYADSRNDVIATAAVLVAAVIAFATGVNLDGWMGLGVAAFILISGFGLVRDTINPLLGSAPDRAYIRYIRDKIKSYPGVLGTHDLIIHDYGPGRRFASAHVEMSSKDDVLDSHDTIDNIERDFLRDDNLNLIIHYDPVVTDDKQVNLARSWAKRQVRAIDTRLSVHDFRMVEGPSHINYVFDVLAPYDLDLSEQELLRRIHDAVQRGDKPIDTVVTIDRDFSELGDEDE